MFLAVLKRNPSSSLSGNCDETSTQISCFGNGLDNEQSTPKRYICRISSIKKSPIVPPPRRKLFISTEDYDNPSDYCESICSSEFLEEDTDYTFLNNNEQNLHVSDSKGKYT